MNIAIQQIKGNSVHVSVTGRLTQEDIGIHEEPLAVLLGPNPYAWSVLLDMSAVDYMDSSGVGWLVRTNKRFRQDEGCIILHSLSSIARNTIKLLKLDSLLQIAENERQAIKMIEGNGDA